MNALVFNELLSAAREAHQRFPALAEFCNPPMI